MPASASPPPSPPVRTPGQQPSHPASATNRSRTPQNDRFALYSPRNPDRRWIRGKTSCRIFRGGGGPPFVPSTGLRSPLRGVTAARVIPALDPFEDRGDELGPGRSAAAVEQLELQRPEERLHHRVVDSRRDPAHRVEQAGGAEAVPEGPRGVLGGFKWSSQHLEVRSRDGKATGVGDEGNRKTADVVSRPSTGCAS